MEKPCDTLSEELLATGWFFLKEESDMAERTRQLTLEGYLRYEGRTLIAMTAHSAQRNAYAPHSGFKVGAAILARVPVSTSSGQPDSLRVFGGCNVENAAFGSGVCAETSALTAAIAAGAGPADIIACYVVGTSRPCAGCLQQLAEFSPVQDPIMIHCNNENHGEWLPLTALLPNQFPDAANAAAIKCTAIVAPPGRVTLVEPHQRRGYLLQRYEALAGLATIATRVPPNGYSPYSEFPVRAVVLTRNRLDPDAPWKTFCGCNIENAVHGLTACAESVALYSALMAGVSPRDVIACAIVGPTEEPITMCGGCRQTFSEFSPTEDPMMIFCGNKFGQGKWLPFTEILPRQFP